MNKLAVYAIVALAPFLLAATITQGNLYGRYNDGVYLAPSKLFQMKSPFPDEPTVSDGSINRKKSSFFGCCAFHRLLKLPF